MDMDMDMDHAGASCVISMLWNWNVIDTCFISKTWHVRSRGAFAASCLGVLGLMFLLEFLRKTTKRFDAHIVSTFRARIEAIQDAQRRGGGGETAAAGAAGASDSFLEQGRGLKEVETVGSSPAMTPACCRTNSGGAGVGGGEGAGQSGPAGCCNARKGTIVSNPSRGASRPRLLFPLRNPSSSTTTTIKVRATFLQQAIRSILYMATFTVAYFVMLLAMYYNGYFLICIFLGSGLAHFLIDGFELQMDVNDAAEGDGMGRGMGRGKGGAGGAGALDEPTVCCG